VYPYSRGKKERKAVESCLKIKCREILDDSMGREKKKRKTTLPRGLFLKRGEKKKKITDGLKRLFKTPREEGA